MQSPPFPLYLIPPKLKYSPQHHILKHPQPAFLPQCQRPGFTPIQNNMQNYSSIYLSRSLIRYAVQTAAARTSFQSKAQHIEESRCDHTDCDSPLWSLCECKIIWNEQDPFKSNCTDTAAHPCCMCGA